MPTTVITTAMPLVVQNYLLQPVGSKLQHFLPAPVAKAAFKRNGRCPPSLEVGNLLLKSTTKTILPVSTGRDTIHRPGQPDHINENANYFSYLWWYLAFSTTFLAFYPPRIIRLLCDSYPSSNLSSFQWPANGLCLCVWQWCCCASNFSVLLLQLEPEKTNFRESTAFSGIVCLTFEATSRAFQMHTWWELRPEVRGKVWKTLLWKLQHLALLLGTLVGGLSLARKWCAEWKLLQSLFSLIF